MPDSCSASGRPLALHVISSDQRGGLGALRNYLQAHEGENPFFCIEICNSPRNNSPPGVTLSLRMSSRRPNDILRPWLIRLKSPSKRTGEDISCIPVPVRIALLNRGLAHLRDGCIEITFDGIKELHRLDAVATRDAAADVDRQDECACIGGVTSGANSRLPRSWR